MTEFSTASLSSSRKGAGSGSPLNLGKISAMDAMRVSKEIERIHWVCRHSDGAIAFHPTWRHHVFVTGIDHPLFNTVLHLPVALQTAQTASNLIAALDKELVPAVWRLDSEELAQGFPNVLEERGILETGELHYLAAPMAGLPSLKGILDFEILKVTDLESLLAWTEVTCLANAMTEAVIGQLQELELNGSGPAYAQEQRFLGLLRGEPIAAFSLCQNGQHVGIFGLAVMPKFQGQGVGREMLASLPNLCSASGLVTLQSGPDSLGFYVKSGFSEVGSARTFLQMPSTITQLTEERAVLCRLRDLLP